MSNFNPELYQCTTCLTKMKSNYPGQFVRCECGESFVDQTVHYGRYGGQARSLSYLIEKDLKDLSGLGYEEDDIKEILTQFAYTVLIPSSAVDYEVNRQYNSNISALGNTSPRELVEAGRGHKVIEYLQALLEGY